MLACSWRAVEEMVLLTALLLFMLAMWHYPWPGTASGRPSHYISTCKLNFTFGYIFAKNDVLNLPCTRNKLYQRWAQEGGSRIWQRPASAKATHGCRNVWRLTAARTGCPGKGLECPLKYYAPRSRHVQGILRRKWAACAVTTTNRYYICAHNSSAITYVNLFTHVSGHFVAVIRFSANRLSKVAIWLTKVGRTTSKLPQQRLILAAPAHQFLRVQCFATRRLLSSGKSIAIFSTVCCISSCYRKIVVGMWCSPAKAVLWCVQVMDVELFRARQQM